MFTKTTQEGRNARNILSRLAWNIRRGEYDAIDATVIASVELRAQGGRPVDIRDHVAPLARAAFRSVLRRDARFLASLRPVGVL